MKMWCGGQAVKTGNGGTKWRLPGRAHLVQGAATQFLVVRVGQGGPRRCGHKATHRCQRRQRCDRSR